MPSTVFISYSHRQGMWVWNRLVPCLKAGGTEVLIDRERFEAGKELVGQMDATQDLADKSVLVLSPDYLGSTACRRELRRAVNRDPTFSSGLVLPVMRRKCDWRRVFKGSTPLYVDLTRDHKPEPWKLLFSACGSNLGTDAPQWLKARDEIQRFLERNQSVNLVVQEGVAWSQLIEHLGAERVPDLVTVNLEKPSTVSRRGLVQEVLRSLSVSTPVPPEPEDLAVFGQVLDERSVSRVALTHFDLAAHRDTYGINLYSSLRYLLMESRKLVLLVQSKKPFAAMLPEGHPLSMIDIKTVEIQTRS